jgi:hypothetical protein
MSKRVIRVIDPIESERIREACIIMRKRGRVDKQQREDSVSSDEEEINRRLIVESKKDIRKTSHGGMKTQKKIETQLAIKRFQERERMLRENENLVKKMKMIMEQDEDPLKGFPSLGLANSTSFDQK